MEEHETLETTETVQEEESFETPDVFFDETVEQPAEIIENEAVTYVPGELTEAFTEVPSAADVDAVQLFADATSVLSNVILCAALVVAGVLCGIRFWR